MFVRVNPRVGLGRNRERVEQNHQRHRAGRDEAAQRFDRWRVGEHGAAERAVIKAKA
jgi:hypothetical protein